MLENLKEDIIQFMSGKKYIPMDEEEFSSSFCNSRNITKNDVLTALNELKEEYIVMESGKGNLILASTKGFFKGVVTGVFEEHIFVKIEKYDRDVKVEKKRKDIVLPKDEVLIHLGENETLEKVIKHNMNVLVGEVCIKEVSKGVYEYSLIPQSKKLNITLKLSKEKCKNLVNGHKVIYELVSTKVGVEPIIKSVIGYKDDPLVDITAFVLEAEAPIDFSEACIKEAEEVSRDVDENDLKIREDYRNNMIFTIDGDDAKDFDDAVEVYEKEDGGYHIGVHIADVSSFVSKDGAIDKDAVERGTSIYLIYSVIPMLPQILSNGKCSLVPHQDRLTMSFIMDIDSQGSLIGGEIKLGVINSKRRFTYNEVNKIVEDRDVQTIEENKEFVPMLEAMIKASAALRKNRDRRGQLELDIPEAKVITDENGHPIDITLRNRGLAEMAIEDLMILTNEFVASTFYNMNLPFMYRVHEAPSEEKIDRFMHTAKSMGHSVKNKKNGYHSNDVRMILESEKDGMVRMVLSSLLLRSLPKAYYGPENIGHFGLASNAYMQVTSPIRRYPDLVAHRLIKDYLFSPEKFNDLNFDSIYQYLYETGLTTSSQEKRAEQLERDVTKMKMAEYMEDKIGEIYVGKISGFTDKGMFVQLSNMIEGYVKFEYLKDDIYIYDKDRMLAYGKRSNRQLKIGSEFKIKVARASKAESLIDFDPVDFKTKKTDNGNRHNRRKGRKNKWIKG